MAMFKQDPKYAQRIRLANAMITTGMDSSPIHHPMQAVGRLAQSYAGHKLAERTENEEEDRRRVLFEQLADAISGTSQSANDSSPNLIDPAQVGQPPISNGRRRLVDTLMRNPDTAEFGGQMAMQLMMEKPPERKIIKGADGYNYYQDSGERVLPNIQVPQDRKTAKDINDHLRYLDSGERVFPSVSKMPGQEDKAAIAKTAFSNADKLRDEFNKGSGAFIKARDAYGPVLASAKDPSPAGDLAMIFNYMKVLDPGSVVRESEFATAAASGAFGERIKASVNRVLSGQRLSDDMRTDFVNRAGMLYQEQESLHEQLREQYGGLSERFEVSPENVLIDYRGQFEMPDQGETQEVPPRPDAKRAPDGSWYVPDPGRPGKYLRIEG